MLQNSLARSFVIAVAFFLLLLSLTGIFFGIPIALRGRVDFRQLYTAGHMVRTGHRTQLYDYAQTQTFQSNIVSPSHVALPFNHLAYESLLYVPLSFAPYRIAYTLFFAFNLILLAASFRMLRPYLSSLSQVWRFLPIALFASFFPVAVALIQGQDSILLLALMISATVLLDRGNPFRAGMLLGLTLFKFQYAIPVAILFILWRRWRFVSGFAVSAVIVAGVSLWLTGWSGVISYVHLLGEMSAKFSSTYIERYGIRPDSMPNLRGLAYVLAKGSPFATQAIALFLSGLVLLRAGTRPPSLPLALLAALLVSYHQVLSDMTLMTLPLGWALSRSILASGRNATSIRMTAAIIFAGVTITFLVPGAPFYVLAIPATVLVAIWNAPVGSAFTPAAKPGKVLHLRDKVFPQGYPSHNSS